MESEKLAFLIREISVSLFTDLAESDKIYLGKDLNAIMKNDPVEALRNLNDLYDSLVDCKDSIQQVEFFDEFSENQGYQKALQKLDKEVRNHIKHELQMKVFIDSLDEKLLVSNEESMNSLEGKKKLLEKLKRENKEIKAKLAAKDSEIKTYTSTVSAKDLASINQKMQKDAEKISDLERSIALLKQKWTQAKIELDCKNREYEKHKKDFVFLKKSQKSTENFRANTQLDKSDRAFKESFESLIKGNRITKAPTKIIKSVSPLPYQQKLLQQLKNTQSAKRIEKSPLGSAFRSEPLKIKSKSRLGVLPSK